jgi:N-acetylmuramoyl-L-alanine amidase
MSQSSAFIDMMKPYAIKEWRRARVLPSLTIAQGALESGWGKYAPHNNYFGVKSHGSSNGQTVTTKEFINGQWITIQDSFRTYDTCEGSIQDHSDFLTQNGRYAKVLGERDYKAACHAVHAAGYATDPNYATLLIQIIEGSKLYEIDKLAFAAETPIISDADLNAVTTTWLDPAIKAAQTVASEKQHLQYRQWLKDEIHNPLAIRADVANVIIATWLGPAWKASKDQKQKDYIHHLANALRKASGQKET